MPSINRISGEQCLSVRTYVAARYKSFSINLTLILDQHFTISPTLDQYEFLMDISFKVTIYEDSIYLG